MTKNWQQFWSNYRNIEAKNERDLYLQVGKTVNKKPIPSFIFHEMIRVIVDRLKLSTDDHLVDFCCGNGLVTCELAPEVRQVTAMDFADHLILAAKQFKQLPNISYHVGDITQPLDQVLAGGMLPTKFLMNDSLGYFSPATLHALLANIVHHMQGRPFSFLLTGIPNQDLKWNFYNTAERRARHLENEKQADNTNDGLGRWWSVGEIQELCTQMGLHATTENQSANISDYRMDALITCRI